MRTLSTNILRRSLRLIAYLAAFLLALVWIASALAALSAPIPGFTDPAGRGFFALVHFAGLDPAGMLAFGRALAGAKLALGLILVSAVVTAIGGCARRRACDDAVLDVALLFSALGSVAAGAPIIVAGGGQALQAVMGELLLCAIAHGLSTHGRGLSPIAVVAAAEGPYVLPSRNHSA